MGREVAAQPTAQRMARLSATRESTAALCLLQHTGKLWALEWHSNALCNTWRASLLHGRHEQMLCLLQDPPFLWARGQCTNALRRNGAPLGYVNAVSKRCACCKKLATFGPEGVAPTHYAAHSAPLGFVDVSKRCRERMPHLPKYGLFRLHRDIERSHAPVNSLAPAARTYVVRTAARHNRKHTSRKTCASLVKNHVAYLPWPSQSANLNPIEQLWPVLKRRVNAQPTPGTVKQLWERLEREWWAIDPAQCRRLVEPLPRRIEAVIKARGGHIRY